MVDLTKGDDGNDPYEGGGTQPSSAPVPPPMPAGWYPAPGYPGETRYWDGTAWAASSPPPPPGAGAPPPPPVPYTPVPAYGQPAPWTGARTGVGPIEAMQMYFTRAGDYRGRSSRSEYWWPFLIVGVFSFIVSFLVGVAFPGAYNARGVYVASDVANGVQGILTIAGLVFGLPLTIRRLHDSGKPWPYLLFGFLCGIVLLVFMVLDTQMAVNKWGQPPK